jgi:hypothetical protein
MGRPLKMGCQWLPCLSRYERCLQRMMMHGRLVVQKRLCAGLDGPLLGLATMKTRTILLRNFVHSDYIPNVV